MYRRRFVVLFLGTTSLAGCLSRDSDTSDTQPRKETEVETSTATRRTAEGITATFRVVDSHTPTSNTAEATFDDSKPIYENFDTLAARTREHIDDCACDRRRGCPPCVMSEDCGNNNDPLDTVTGKMILDDVLEAIP